MVDNQVLFSVSGVRITMNGAEGSIFNWGSSTSKQLFDENGFVAQTFNSHNVQVEIVSTIANAGLNTPNVSIQMTQGRLQLPNFSDCGVNGTVGSGHILNDIELVGGGANCQNCILLTFENIIITIFKDIIITIFKN